MQILIVGCGKVGKTLTEHLSKENHNITVMDTNAERVHHLADVYDVMGIIGNGTDYEKLDAADIAHTDLLIAVTYSDEVNLLCCVMARKTAGCKTIARVRNPIYSTSRDHIQRELGLSMMINPEHAAAREIIQLITMPSAIEINTFAKGQINMMRFKVPEGSSLIGQAICDIGAQYEGLLICTAENQKGLVIPDGNYIIGDGDIISIVAQPDVAENFLKKIGYKTDAIRNMMIIGGGETTFYLTQILQKMGINVTIIEQRMERCESLSERLPRASVICGDGSDQDLLHEEHLENFDAFLAATGIDEENIILSLYAMGEVQRKVITKISHLDFNDVIRSLNLDSVVNPKIITADYILQYIRAMDNSFGSNVETLYKLMDDRVEALEFLIRPSCSLTGIKLQDMKLKKNLLIAGIARGSKLIRPSGQDTFEEGDKVIVVTTENGFRDINDIIDHSLMHR